MGRIRTIKPEFFKHEALFDAEEETGLPLRVAFAGLWTICDRAGRFEWRPRAIKTDVLPYDQVDFPRVLDALVTRGFVVRYRVDGKEYGFVPGFSKHQVINGRETESKLPAPTEVADNIEETTRQARVDHASGTRHDLAHGEGKGREGERKGREEEESSTTTTREADENREADKKDAPVVVDDQSKRRDEVLRLMGLDGCIKPDGKFTGTTNDTAEIQKWDALGLTRSEQDAKIREMLEKQRRQEPGFLPSTWRWFTTGMADLAAAKARGIPASSSALSQQSEREKHLAHLRKLAGMP